MMWTAVVVTAPAEMAEAIANFLIESGAPGLQTEEDAASACMTAHFPGDVPIAALGRFCDSLASLFPGAPRPEIQLAPVADDDWVENWKAHFPPLAIGDRLFVHPPWIDSVPNGRIGIVIDPGMAFGTGHHASTRGCLCLLERALPFVPAPRVLDLGTGSGLLAIAAAKLGAREIWAIDIDAEARRVATENADVNQVREVINVAAALDEVPGRFDLMLANLFAAQLVELADEVTARLQPKGAVIGSGITIEEAAAVREAWSAAGLLPHDEYEEEGWVTLAFRQPS